MSCKYCGGRSEKIKTQKRITLSAILGINFGHDGAAALVINGKLAHAIAKERITRIKKDSGVNKATIDYLLNAAGISLTDISVVSFSSYFYRNEHEDPNSYIKFFDLSGQPVRKNLVHLIGGNCAQEFVIEIDGIKKPAILIQHHLAHAASAYYTSPYNQAACFSCDASGVHPEFCSLFAHGEGNKLHYLYCPGIMAGNVYSVFTERLGIGPGLTKAGTTMALAAFGTAPPYSKNWETDFDDWYSRKFQNSDAIHTNYLWTKWTGLSPSVKFENEIPPSQIVKDHAAGLQYAFEKILVKYAKKLFLETKNFNGGNLILCGGSFLNSDANMKIFREAGFSNIHLFPACGDDGTAVGAALYTAHMIMNQPRFNYEAKDFMYLGREYFSEKEEPNYQEVAQLLAEGKIIAWFQGRSEFGPRALGNRSFLADPRSPKMKDHINTEIKHRESYRPFAPAVLSEKTEDWFDIPFESKLMLFITQIKQPDLIPAVAHIDDSARVQSVNKMDNPKFHKLLVEFENITGVPVLLNTSLNDNNEPIVESPEDAKNLFNKLNIDNLVVGGKLINKI